MVEIIKKIKTGEYGLARTFWLFLILPSVLFRFVVELGQGGDNAAIFIPIVAISIPYFFVALIGTSKAAKTYKGNSLWKTLAGLVVLVGWLMMAAFCIGLLIALFMKLTGQ